MASKIFSIPVLLPETDVLTFLSISQTADRFRTVLFGDDILLQRITYGNWRLIEGEISKQLMDSITDAIDLIQSK